MIEIDYVVLFRNFDQAFFRSAGIEAPNQADHQCGRYSNGHRYRSRPFAPHRRRRSRLPFRQVHNTQPYHPNHTLTSPLSPHTGGLPDSDASLYLHKINNLLNTARSYSSVPANSESSGTAARNIGESAAMLSIARLPPLTFSFGRGLQGDAMRMWVKGDEKGAKESFEARAKVCAMAARGELMEG